MENLKTIRDHREATGENHELCMEWHEAPEASFESSAGIITCHPTLNQGADTGKQWYSFRFKLNGKRIKKSDLPKELGE